MYGLGSSKAFSPHPCHWTRMLDLYGQRLGDCPPGLQCDKQVTLTSNTGRDMKCTFLGLGELVDNIPQVRKKDYDMSNPR